jgi:hypothetical protein
VRSPVIARKTYAFGSSASLRPIGRFASSHASVIASSPFASTVVSAATIVEISTGSYRTEMPWIPWPFVAIEACMSRRTAGWDYFAAFQG